MNNISNLYSNKNIAINEDLMQPGGKVVLSSETETYKYERNVKINTDIPSISLNGYTKIFKKFVAAYDINLNVGHGVIHGFIGPNGSGKTTCIKAMIGAYVSKRGMVSINGYNAGTVKANTLIGYIPERASFPKHLNSISYLKSMGQLAGLKAKHAKRKAKRIMEDLGLEKHIHRKPITFSSGMQKKILLAQALITDPEILILDEPAANLDPTARKDLFDELINLRQKGKTIFISSHILAELERIIDEVSFMCYSKLIFTGKISEIESEKSDVFIKTSNNLLVKNLIIKKFNYEVLGDVQTEISISNLLPLQSKALFKFILSIPNIEIKSLRANDLQSIYDKLIAHATLQYENSKKIQNDKIKKPKTVVMKQEDITKNEIPDAMMNSIPTDLVSMNPTTKPKPKAMRKKPIKKKSIKKKVITKKAATIGDHYIIQKSTKRRGWEIKKTNSKRATFVASTKAEVQEYYKKNLKSAVGAILTEKGRHGKIKKVSRLTKKTKGGK